MFSPPTSVLAVLSFRHLKLRKLQQKNLTMAISPENRWVKDQQVDSHFLISSFFLTMEKSEILNILNSKVLFVPKDKCKKLTFLSWRDQSLFITQRDRGGGVAEALGGMERNGGEGGISHRQNQGRPIENWPPINCGGGDAKNITWPMWGEGRGGERLGKILSYK